MRNPSAILENLYQGPALLLEAKRTTQGKRNIKRIGEKTTDVLPSQ